MHQSKRADELSNNILKFHQINYGGPKTHQNIADPKGAFFQYSRYYGILKEFNNVHFQNFLDVGCAEGMYPIAVKRRWPDSNVYGVDFSAKGLQKANAYFGKLGYITCADIVHLPFKDSSFDLILCSETLEHVVNDTGAIKELRRICNETCIITVPSFCNERARKRFEPDLHCRRDSHLRKYSITDLEEKLGAHFGKVIIYNLSSWYLSSADMILHLFISKRVASFISRVISPLAAFDYRMSKAGAHGHSYICICSVTQSNE